MQGIGNILRRERVERNLTLDEVAEKTKIRVKYLQAIEEEHFDLLPGPVYVKGFISSYIKCLGIGDLPEVQAVMNAKPKPAAQIAERPVEPEVRKPISAREEEEIVPKQERKRKAAEKGKRYALEEKPLNKKRSMIVVLSILAIVALLVVQWIYNGGNQSQEPLPEVVPPTVEDDMQQPGEEKPQPEEPAVPPEPVYDGLELQLEIIDLTVGTEDKCWLEVRADGSQVLNTTMTEGQTQTINATESIRVHLGNAGVVRIVLNGQDLGTLGSKGQVVSREFTLEDIGQTAG